MFQHTFRIEEAKGVIKQLFQEGYPLWYFAGYLVLMGRLNEPFSSAELAEACRELGLEYDDATYNYYPQKHSINYGEEGVTQVFITEKRLYENYYDAERHRLSKERNQKLDREAFQEALEKEGWESLIEEARKRAHRDEYRDFVDLLNKLQREKKISPERRRELDAQWRNSLHQRKYLLQQLEHMLEEGSCV